MSKKAFIGRKLREARMYRGKTIDVLAKETNINKKDIIAFEEDNRDAVATGMNGHIAKPIQIDKLLSMLAEVLRQ